MNFPNAASEFVYIRTYSRWIEELKRRETWEETVERYINFLKEERRNLIPEKVIRKAHEKILNFEVMPSMRALWAAGPAAKADNATLYNCAFLSIDSINSFSEAIYILMCGTGVGFSVSKKYVELLPVIPKIGTYNKTVFDIEDSRAGWADSIKTLLTALYSGYDVEFDYSRIRSKGSRLITMGGRSSGAAPLISLHSFIRDTFYSSQGRKLKPIECHDIQNQIEEIVIVGGVRRSAQSSLSDLNDEEMRGAKDFPFPPRRSMANNSAVYENKPTAIEFLKEWSSLALSGSGERGIFNLEAARNNSPNRRKAEQIQGVNPCFEILLRKKQFCNLSTVVIKSEDDLDSLLEKVETA